ncbi:MAG TPA: hypothetical protein VJ843_00405 [Candidatus Saccharimonadales bacterium]|nr:hypothetical protein [Candidatus Saccharimonadales bacterium]
MKTKVLNKLLRISLLGVANGIFSSAVCVALDRINFYYAVQKYEENLNEVERFYQETGTHFQIYNPVPYQLWWIRAACLNVGLFILATLLSHMLIGRKVKSVFLRWQVVSVLVIAAWAVAILIIEVVESLVTGKSLSMLLKVNEYEEVTMWGFVLTTLAVNLVWGFVIKASARDYEMRQSERPQLDGAV